MYSNVYRLVSGRVISPSYKYGSAAAARLARIYERFTYGAFEDKFVDGDPIAACIGTLRLKAVAHG